MKKLLGFLLLFAIVGAAGAWIWSGRQPPPSITIASPGAAMGASGVIDLSIEAPRGQLTLLDVVFEQNAKQTTLFTLAQQGGATLTQAGPDTLHLTLPATRKAAARSQVRRGASDRAREPHGAPRAAHAPRRRGQDRSACSSSRLRSRSSRRITTSTSVAASSSSCA
jgi:hypothetical protein